MIAPTFPPSSSFLYPNSISNEVQVVCFFRAWRNRDGFGLVWVGGDFDEWTMELNGRMEEGDGGGLCKIR